MSTDNRRVTFLIESLGIGGAERVVSNLATAFDGNGWAVDVVVTRETGPMEEKLPDSVAVRSLDSRRTLASFRPLVAYLRERRPDVLIANMTHINVIAALATRFARVGTSLVVVEHSMLSDRIERMDGRKELATAKLARYVYPWADVIVAVSDGLADDVASVTGINRSAITTIYNPIVTDEITDRANEPVDLPAFADDVPVVVSVGRLEVRKDVPTLLRAFQRVLKHRECRLVICGDGPKRADIEELANALKIDEHVTFAGWVDNPYKYMRQADVFALSSTVEGLSNVLVEALAVGCPVVSTDCESGPAEILEGGRWGELVPVGDHEALSAAITTTLESSVEATQLRARANAFTTETAYQHYAKLLEGNQ